MIHIIIIKQHDNYNYYILYYYNIIKSVYYEWKYYTHQIKNLKLIIRVSSESVEEKGGERETWKSLEYIIMIQSTNGS